MSAVQHELVGRDRIVATARQLFTNQGFHQTPMSELASEADVSVGQIYRFFTGKSALIRAIIREDATARIAEMTAVRAELDAGHITVEAALTELCLQALQNGNEALSFDILAEAHRDAEVAATIAEFCRAGRLVIGGLALAVNPDVSEVQREGAEEMILALMFGLGHRTLSQPSMTPEETAKRTADMVYSALRAL